MLITLLCILHTHIVVLQFTPHIEAVPWPQEAITLDLLCANVSWLLSHHLLNFGFSIMNTHIVGVLLTSRLWPGLRELEP